MKFKLKPYILYGKHATLAAMQNPNRTIKKVLCTTENLNLPEFKKHIQRFPYQIVDRSHLDKILGTNSIHQGIAIETLPITSHDLNSIDFNTNQTIVILDHITDQQNFGSILRSASTFGIKNIIIPSDNGVHENANLAKTASGALELVNIIEVVNINQTIENLKKKGFWIIGLDHNAENLLHQYNIPAKLVIVLGNENQGIRKLTRSKCDYLVKIPITQSNTIDSLNVAVAAAITFYEAFKYK